MAATTTTPNTTSGFRLPTIRLTRGRIIGLFLIIAGALLIVNATQNMLPEMVTNLTLETGPVDEVPSIPIQTQAYTLFMGVFFIASGIVAQFMTDSFPTVVRRAAFGMLVICGILFIPTILISSVGQGATNITTMFAESLRLATPVAIGAMAGIWCERSGVINIAIEGMMLFAACFGFTAFFYLRDVVDIGSAQWLAVLIGIGSGGLIALLHAWLSITFRTDQIVSGTVINILAIGVTSFVRREYLLSTEAGTIKLPNIDLPILSDLPIVGNALFRNQPIFYMMFVIIILTHVMLFYTRWGLRTRAVGEHPHAADTLGVNVNRMRWINVFIGGAIAGVAGAWFSLETTGQFVDNMTRGSGFIALAAMIFGKWMPFGAFGAALLFGFSDALGTRLQIIDVNFPVQFLQMVPYLVTIIVLAGFIGRALPPKASGKPYTKE